MRNIYSHISEISAEITPMVIATVIFTRGSTPQKPGSSALFSRHGLEAGTVGGGILEGRVQELAIEATVSGRSGIYSFELDKEIEHRTEAICGGYISVLIEAGIEKHINLFRTADKYLSAGMPCTLGATIKFSDGVLSEIKRFIVPETETVITGFPAAESIKINEALRTLFRDPVKADFTCIGLPGEENLILLESLFPLPRLIIAGAGHIGKALCHVGKLLDFEVTVVDDRPEFANMRNLPDATHVIAHDIGETISDLKPGADSYVVIVTRGHTDDSSALKACIGGKAKYIGMIGSRTKIEKMHRNFIDNGWASEEEWKAVHAPIGVEINSKTIEEIAISIAAELIKVRNS